MYLTVFGNIRIYHPTPKSIEHQKVPTRDSWLRRPKIECRLLRTYVCTCNIEAPPCVRSSHFRQLDLPQIIIISRLSHNVHTYDRIPVQVHIWRLVARLIALASLIYGITHLFIRWWVHQTILYLCISRRDL